MGSPEQFTDEISDIDIEFARRQIGARQYREYENRLVSLRGNIAKYLENPEVIAMRNLFHPHFAALNLEASKYLLRMEEIQDKYNLEIGGEDGAYVVGTEYALDVFEHNTPGVSEESQPEKIIVVHSEIGTVFEDGEQPAVLLPARFARIGPHLREPELFDRQISQ